MWGANTLHAIKQEVKKVTKAPESDAQQQQQQQRQLNPSYQKRQQGDSKPKPKPHALGNRLNAWWSVGVPLWGM